MSTHPISMVRYRRTHAAVRALVVLTAILFAVPAQAQSKAREGFVAVQKQVDTVRPNVIKATVALLRRSGSGSGVIISPDGYVLTAAHVIAGGRTQSIQVLLSDGRRVPGTILGSNKENDFGLVKIDEPENLPVAPLGDSSTLRRGQWVLATGHPLGPQYQRPPVLRIGRVLFLHRDEDTRETDSVMTDAPIISGDSGGPLYDLNGRVVGINSMVLQGDRRMSSIHVPVDLPKLVMSILKKGDNPTESDIVSAPFTKAVQEAQDALRAGDLDQAARFATQAADIDPTSARARLLQARAYARRGKPAQALAAIEQACSLGFNDSENLKRENDLASLEDTPGLKKVLDRLAVISGIPGNRKGDQWVLAAATNVEPGVDRGVVRIVSNSTQVALGTVMSATGDILTKASELPDGPITCVLPDGKKSTLERIQTDPEWDIALLKADTRGLEPLTLADPESVGVWTFSPDAAGGVSAIGMVSVTDLPVRGKGIISRPTSKAYLGIALNPLPPAALDRLGLKSGVIVDVEPGFPAAKAGLKSGDILFEAEGKPVTDPDSFMDFMLNKKPGDTLDLRVAREDEKLNLTVNLSERPANIPGRGGLLAQLSGDISRMHGPFPRVLQHDTVLKPNVMGGPLLDLEGRCIGINIARADRTSTYAVAAKDVKEIYSKLKAR